MKIIFFLLTFMVSITSCRAAPSNSLKSGEMTDMDILKLVQEDAIQSVAAALEDKANVNAVDDTNRSLLLISTVNKQTEMAKLLVKFGADVNQQSDNYDSPFLYAGASGQTELVQLYLDNGARFDIFNRYNGSALIPACERGHVETVRLLVNTKGYPIDHVNRLGWTGVMEAIVLGDGSKKYQQIVQILKDAGAKMDIPDHDGVTPLQHAQSRGYGKIISIIKS